MSNTITIGPKAKNRLERIKEMWPDVPEESIVFLALSHLEESIRAINRGSQVLFYHGNGNASKITFVDKRQQ